MPSRQLRLGNQLMRMILHGSHVAFCRADVSGVANETGVFQRGTTDGILGLAHQNGSSMYEKTGRRPLWETLVDGRNVAHDAFALCLEPGGVGGFLALGAPPLEGTNGRRFRGANKHV
jgi:hypothetical protein